MAHIGTFSTLGVKSGMKDICRVFNVPFLESNNISKAIDEISDEPSLTFKKLDAMADGDEGEKAAWKKFHDLEEKYPEYFRLARKFEGIPRGMGVHASGILVTPMPVTDLFPVRYKDGTAITLYTGPQLEHFGAIKYDILGLKTIDIITKAIDNIDSIKDINELYDKADITDAKVWEYIANKNTEAVFQIESNMMKGIVDRIKPSCFADLGAICAIGRPGPISIGLDKKYADTKHGNAQIEYPIRGCEDILDETFGSPVYQEQLMFISKKISGFDDMQADSITRKVLGKKKVEMFPMMKRCHVYGKKNCEGPEGWEQDDNAPWYDPKGKYGKEIPGALVNGYSAKEVLDYFDKIEGFAKYCFNKAHSACYAYIAWLTAWLKFYYPAEFMSAVMSMADADDIPFYSQTCENKLSLEVRVPDINISKKDFTPDGNSILYGLGSVKGVGDSAIPDIVTNAPYTSIQDCVDRIPKKAFNKRVAESLIKAGAFDWLNDNRIELLNELHEIRGDKEKNEATGKKEVIWEDPSNFDESTRMAMEEEVLGSHITDKTWWETVSEGQVISFSARIKSIKEHTDKKGNLMAFVQLIHKDCPIEAVVFASKYAKLASAFYGRENKFVAVSGKKTDKGSVIVNEAMPERVFLEDIA